MTMYPRAIVSGFVATVALSLVMLFKSAMDLMPALNVIHMLAALGHGLLSLPASPAVGWLLHFIIGAVLWGIAFALLYPTLPGQRPVAKGMAFSVLAWVLMMLIVMPLAGAGLFGLHMGIMAPVMTLVLHLIWGAVLGATFGYFSRSAARA